MTLRTKTLLAGGLTLIALTGALYIVAARLLLDGFAAVEKQEATKNVQRTAYAVDSLLLRLDDAMLSWAQWDESYRFIRTNDPKIRDKFSTISLGDAVLATTRSDVIIYIRNNGRIVFGKGYDQRASKTVPLPAGLLAHLGAGSLLLRHRDVKSSHHGIVLLPQGPLQLVSRPVVTNVGTGPIYGSLIWGRFLDDAAMKEVSKLVKLPLSRQRFDSSRLPPDFQTARLLLTGGNSQPYVNAFDASTIAGYSQVRDIYGEPALLMRTDTHRDTSKQGHVSVRYLLLSLLTIGLIFGGLALWGLERWVLARLSLLSSNVVQIGASGDTSLRVPVTGSDELSQLSVSVNHLLVAVEKAHGALQGEIEQRRRAEALLQQAHDNLEVRIQERTSELQKINAELSSSEARFRMLTEVMPQIVWTARPDGFLDYYNRHWIEYTGMTIEQTQGWGWQPVLHPDDLENCVDRWTESVRTGENYEVEYRFKRASDGAYRWHLGRALPLRDEAGNISRWFGTCTDIDDQKRAQLELQRSQFELESLVQERTGELLQASQEQQRLLAKLERANLELESRVMRRTATLAQTNSELQIAQKEAERANLAKSEFLSRMSHELRTPMNAILGFGQILDSEDLTPLQKESVGYVLKGGHHLLGLINEVLDIARVEAGGVGLSIEPVALDDVVPDACALVRSLASERNIRLDYDLSTLGRSHVLADRQRLKQVLINLLANAIKYNRPGGQVVVSCNLMPSERIRIAVRDTGPGIAPEDLLKLFTPFERLNAANSDVEGTGLGLVLSQRLVTAMGGTLKVASILGQGSTFSIELPQATALVGKPGNSAGADCLADLREPAHRQYSVLCIEDNLSNLRLFEVILAQRPEVLLLSAMQGRVGLDLARQHEPDLILLDLHLPDMSGQEVFAGLRQSVITRDIPVVIISADATAPQVQRLMEAGAKAYLTKPLDVAEFLRLLDAVLQAAESRPHVA